MAHEDSESAATPRILDNHFADRNSGLRLPRIRHMLAPDGPRPVARTGGNTLQTVGPGLQIVSFDRSAPPNYRPGDVPRDAAFNRNVFAITGAPAMPALAVRCSVRGFSPAETPIHWRLQCRHVLARHINVGNYRYSGRTEIHSDEWQGRSTASQFVLFGERPDPSVAYDYNTPRSVAGGHALLTVAARPPGQREWLVDFVHLRVGGANPQQADVVRHLEQVLSGRDPNILRMVRAVFAHESDYTQFRARPQTGTTRLGVRFDWPDDPPNFPLATFDFGVGISQYTRLPTRPISRDVAWDWRENIRSGLNLFLTDNLRRSYREGRTWREWAHRAWRAYNGGGREAETYATRLASTPDGRQVSSVVVPARIDLQRETAHIAGPAHREAAPAWPPQAAPRP